MSVLGKLTDRRDGIDRSRDDRVVRSVFLAFQESSRRDNPKLLKLYAADSL